MQEISLPGIDLIIYDFDGVMTDNKVYVDQDGNETVRVNRADGVGVSEIKKMGVKQIIMSTETNPVVTKRAEKLGIPCLQNVYDKAKELRAFCSTNNISLGKIIYVGNDINDLTAMEIVGFPVCPSDAYPPIKNISKYVFSSKGGEGVVRELFDLIANTKGE